MAATETLEKKLEKLLYRAIDEGTPEHLKRNSEFDSLDKIADKTLAQLELADQGIENMWQTLNAYLPTYGGKRIQNFRPKKSTTPRELWDAIWGALGRATPAIPRGRQ